MSLAWTHDPVWLIVYVLSAWRLTRLVTRDFLPPFPRLRDHVLTKHGDAWWAPLVDCPWCLGFHVSWLLAIVESSPLAGAWHWLAVPLAASALIGLLSSKTE